jgi:hypothetical protein
LAGEAFGLPHRLARGGERGERGFQAGGIRWTQEAAVVGAVLRCLASETLAPSPLQRDERLFRLTLIDEAVRVPAVH